MSAKLLRERTIEDEISRGPERSGKRPPVRTVTVNVAESPLGWLFARGLVSQRQFDAGERLRTDWERAQLAPRVTMAWDATPVARGRGGSAVVNRTPAQLRSMRNGASLRPSLAPARAWPIFSGELSARERACAKLRPHWDGPRVPASSC